MTEAITVSKLNGYIKQIFDAEQLLHNIPVVGEVFGVSLSRNVIYFSLKDENATLPCVCFYPNLINQIVEGAKLIVTGTPNFYVKGGKLNFNVAKVESAGQGQLFEQFIKLKQKLEEEGLFDAAHKKPMPENIKRIGVITSKEGAVLQDIKNVAWRRNPSVDIVLFNTKVQGNLAENEIAHAINVLGQYPDIDVIVVARGGGSLEDLWAYNTEIVARATFACEKPIVSAVGHETDFTIIDFVSDLRAPTPSAAAELLTFNMQEKKQEYTHLKTRFYSTSNHFLDVKRHDINTQSQTLLNLIEKDVILCENNTKQLKLNLQNAFEKHLNQKYYEIGIIENTLTKINPQNILAKGYAKIQQGDKSIQSKQQLNTKQDFEIIFKDGKITATVKEN